MVKVTFIIHVCWAQVIIVSFKEAMQLMTPPTSVWQALEDAHDSSSFSFSLDVLWFHLCVTQSFVICSPLSVL